MAASILEAVILSCVITTCGYRLYEIWGELVKVNRSNCRLNALSRQGIPKDVTVRSVKCGVGNNSLIEGMPAEERVC